MNHFASAKHHVLRNIFRRLVVGVGFLSLLPMFWLLLLTGLHQDHSPNIAMLQAGMGYILFLAYIVFAVAFLLKHKSLAIVSAIVVFLHVFLYAPEWQLPSPLPNTAGKPKLTLYSHNIRFDNNTPMAELSALKPGVADIVFLQELTDETYKALDAAGAFAAYPYRAIDPRTGARGLGMFSKFPLHDVTHVPSPGFAQQRGVTTINGHDVVLWNVHTQSPVAGPLANWQGDLSQLDNRLQQETLPVIAAGDYNATWSHRPFRALIDHGMREAANDRGRGYARTWPMDSPLGRTLHGFIRIDHVLTKNGIRPTSIREGAPNGSDHRATITRLALM